MGSSWTKNRTHVSYIGRWILHHWAIREILAWSFINILNQGQSVTVLQMRKQWPFEFRQFLRSHLIGISRFNPNSLPMLYYTLENLNVISRPWHMLNIFLNLRFTRYMWKSFLICFLQNFLPLTTYPRCPWVLLVLLPPKGILYFKKLCFFIWLHQVLVAVWGIFSWGLKELSLRHSSS